MPLSPASLEPQNGACSNYKAMRFQFANFVEFQTQQARNGIHAVDVTFLLRQIRT